MRRDILQQFGGSCADEILAILVDSERENLYIKFSLSLHESRYFCRRCVNIADISHSLRQNKERERVQRDVFSRISDLDV